MLTDLLNIYCRLFLNPKSGIDRSIVARLIEIIIQGMALQCDLNHKTTITFFTEAFHDVRYAFFLSSIWFVCFRLPSVVILITVWLLSLLAQHVLLAL